MKIGDKVIRSRHDELPTNNPYLMQGVLTQEEGTIVGIRKKFLGEYVWIVRFDNGYITEISTNKLKDR